MSLEISQNLQENTCARVSFVNKVSGLRPVDLSKRRPWLRCFPMNFLNLMLIKFLTTKQKIYFIGNETQSNNKIWPVYVGLQVDNFYKKSIKNLARKLVPGLYFIKS